MKNVNDLIVYMLLMVLYRNGEGKGREKKVFVEKGKGGGGREMK